MSIVSDMQDGKGTVGKLLTDDSLYTSRHEISPAGAKAVANLREASEQAKSASPTSAATTGPLKGLTGSLPQTLASRKDAMADLAENTEALKHNFLFRGFSTSAAISISTTSASSSIGRALESGRSPRASHLGWRARCCSRPTRTGPSAERGGSGSDSTRRCRSSSATRETARSFVEGYGQGTTYQARFLLSRHRAQLVRDHLMLRFGLDQRVAP